MKRRLLRAAFSALHYSGATRMAAPALKPAGAIFCLHQVHPAGGRRTGFAPNDKLACEPEFLEGLINLSRRRGFETVSLGQAVNRLQAGGQGKPFVVFTLDDGYRDNAQFAAPVFRKLDCPYTIFVTPRIADGTCELWWLVLEQIVAAREHIKAEIAGQVIDAPSRSVPEKNRVWLRLYGIFEQLEQHQQRQELRILCKKLKFDIDAFCRSVAMDWKELKALNRDPLCTLGAHTLNHFALAKLKPEDALNELKQSRRLIGEKLGEDILFNAYPYGDRPHAGERDFILAGKAGYLASVTTRKGLCYPAQGGYLQALPRVMVSGLFQQLRYMDAMLSGLPTYMAALGKTVTAY